VRTTHSRAWSMCVVVRGGHVRWPQWARGRAAEVTPYYVLPLRRRTKDIQKGLAFFLGQSLPSRFMTARGREHSRFLNM
jgi:hypothetical protein